MPDDRRQGKVDRKTWRRLISPFSTEMADYLPAFRGCPVNLLHSQNKFSRAARITFFIQPSQVQAARKTVGRNAQTGKPSPQFMRFAPEGGPGCALLAGSITSIKPGPFQIGTREDRARRPCRSPAALQGLSGIGIPNRKPRHVILADDVPFAVALSFWIHFADKEE